MRILRLNISSIYFEPTGRLEKEPLTHNNSTTPYLSFCFSVLFFNFAIKPVESCDSPFQPDGGENNGIIQCLIV